MWWNSVLHVAKVRKRVALVYHLLSPKFMIVRVENIFVMPAVQHNFSTAE
jgi:hypothetical protein